MHDPHQIPTPRPIWLEPHSALRTELRKSIPAGDGRVHRGRDARLLPLHGYPGAHHSLEPGEGGSAIGSNIASKLMQQWGEFLSAGICYLF